MFAGINRFWAQLRVILARAKMSLRRAQNIFMPKNRNSITINITLEGTEKIKTEKNDNKTLWRISFSPALWENVIKLWNGFSILIGCWDRTIIWFSLIFLLVYFSGLKYMPDKVIIIGYNSNRFQGKTSLLQPIKKPAQLFQPFQPSWLAKAASKTW